MPAIITWCDCPLQRYSGNYKFVMMGRQTELFDDQACKQKEDDESVRLQRWVRQLSKQLKFKKDGYYQHKTQNS